MSTTENMRIRILDEMELQESDVLGARTALTAKYVVNREINAAIGHYESTRFRWNEERENQFTTTAQGTRTYSLPAGFMKFDSLKLNYQGDSYIPINPRAWKEIEHRDRDVDGSQGLPVDYAIYGNVLRLYPVPNGAYTLVGSFLKRINIPTSLTGSFCAVTTMGQQSLTATSTASHNSRLNGWTTDGESLIRARAVASVEIFYRQNSDTITEQRQLAAQREDFLSIREMQAFERIMDESQDVQTTGRVMPYFL